MRGRALAIASSAAAWMLASAACFDPDLSSEIPCSSGDRPCPGSLECDEGVCRDVQGGGSIDATIKVDADDRDLDAAPDVPDADEPPPIDASVLGCDPLTHAGCSAPTARCAFIATSTQAPYDGYFACVSASGNNQIGETCRYDTPAGDGHHDNCARGSICGAEQRCRAVCELEQVDACDGDSSLCEDPADVLSPDVSPFGLCEISGDLDDGLSDAAP